MRRFYRRHRNTILKAQAYINAILFLLSACALDSESNAPAVVCGVTLSWLLLFCYANNWFAAEADEQAEDESYTQQPVKFRRVERRKKVM